MSSPNINNSLLCGCVIAHASVFVQPHNYRLSSAMCKARLFLLTMGFSIVFGSLFSKMWRVNRIFSNKKMQRVKIKDSQLLVFIFLLLGVNLTILILWEIIDPLYVEHVMGDVETDYGNEDTLIQYVMDVCSSKHSTTFSVVLYTIQGVLLSFGAFLAWATRNVKIEALNDSRLVGMCIYTVVILCAIGLTLTQVIGDTVFIIDGFVTVGTSFTQLILFSPKVLQVKGIDNVGQLILYLETIVDTQGAAAHVIHEGERNSKSRSSSKNIPSPSKHVRNIASTSNQHPTHTPTTDDIVRRKSPIIEEDNVQTIES